EPRAIAHILKRTALDEDAFVREEATRALEKYDRTVALPYIISGYEFAAARSDGSEGSESGNNEKVREAAVAYVLAGDAEGVVGPEADRVLEQALGDTESIARVAAEYLETLPEDDAIAVLNEAIRNKQPTVRRGAIEVLQTMDSKAATDLILEVYERDIEVEEVKQATRVALRERRRFLDIDQVIRNAREGVEKHARGRALKLLGVVGGADAERVLVSALSDSDIYVRGNAVLAMQWLGSSTVVPSLEELAGDPSNQRIMHLVNNTLKKLRQSEGTN
ncbi:MAG: HEAT repeat domain-containing protein, partial [Myxococcota bacterium]